MAKIKIERNFWSCPNDLLYDKEISLKAKGLYTYIQAKSEDWDYSARWISYENKDGLDWIQAWLNELEKSWYLTRKRFQNKKGHWDVEYTLRIIPVRDIPWKEIPTQEIPVLENPVRENPVTYKTRETKQEKEIKNNNIISKDITVSQISDLSQVSIEKVEYWNKEINDTLLFLRKVVWITDFKEPSGKQRMFCKHIINLTNKIGKEEMLARLRWILEDDFKAKNCNKIVYLYWEIKSFIHSSVVPKKSNATIV